MLYIIIEERSGILLKIYRCLSEAGYTIISNQFGKRKSDSKSFVKLSFDQGTLPLASSVEGSLLNIEGCLDIFYEEPSLNSQQSTLPTNISKDKIIAISKEIITNFNNIEKIVKNFSYHAQNSTADIYHLGTEVGKMIYLREYALGKPLKLEQAIKRMLSEAIKTFGKISFSKNIISIENNVFCNVINPAKQCDFTRGFVTGFIQVSPLTKNVRVNNITCCSQGKNSCSFEFN